MSKCCDQPILEVTREYGTVCMNCMSSTNDQVIENVVQTNYRNLDIDIDREMELSNRMLKGFDQNTRKNLLRLLLHLRKVFKQTKSRNFYKKENIFAFLCDHYGIPHSFKPLKDQNRRSSMEEWILKHIPEQLENDPEIAYHMEQGWVVNCKVEDFKEPKVYRWSDRIDFYRDLIKSG